MWMQMRTRMPRWLRPAVSGALLGLLAIWFPHIIGVGYETTSLALTGQLVLHEAMVFAVLKVVAVAITLGDRPAKPLNAFMLFRNAVYEETKANMPGTSITWSQAIGDRWKKAADAQEKYKAEADAAQAKRGRFGGSKGASDHVGGFVGAYIQAPYGHRKAFHRFHHIAENGVLLIFRG